MSNSDAMADKRFVTLQARLAIQGFTLVCMDCGALLVGRWGFARELPDLNHVAVFVEQVGG